MKKILMGKKTEVFRGRDATECLDECCFSIVYGDQCETLDLMAKDADEANVWITGLMSLMGSSDGKLAGSFVDSCMSRSFFSNKFFLHCSH